MLLQTGNGRKKNQHDHQQSRAVDIDQPTGNRHDTRLQCVHQARVGPAELALDASQNLQLTGREVLRTIGAEGLPSIDAASSPLSTGRPERVSSVGSL